MRVFLQPPSTVSKQYPEDDPDYCVWVPPAGTVAATCLKVLLISKTNASIHSSQDHFFYLC